MRRDQVYRSFHQSCCHTCDAGGHKSRQKCSLLRQRADYRWSLCSSASFFPPFRHHLCLYWPLLEKTCLWLKCFNKRTRTAFCPPQRVSRGLNWFWILNWVIYYQGLPSIYNLKAGPAASVAGLLIGVFTGPGGGGSPVSLPLNACQRVWSFHHQRW